MAVLMFSTAIIDSVGVLILTDLVRIRHNTHNIVNAMSLCMIAAQLGCLVPTFVGGVVIEVRGLCLESFVL
jgi:hypothetical protein